MKDFFKPEDFEDYDSYLRYNLCRDVNEKLNKLIESWPVVQGWYPSTYPQGTWTSSETVHPTSTHRARLAMIEELPKPECKHNPVRFHTGNFADDLSAEVKYKCLYCNVELQATWREVK